jgi:PHD/YefM family antitoxin component YafN of YafNO toxin-antitoxin module
MVNIHKSYLVNEKGKKSAVIIKNDEFDCLDIDANIAKGLKDIEAGKVYDIEKLLVGG